MRLLSGPLGSFQIKWKRPKIRRLILLILLLYILYLLVGMLAPFARQKKLGSQDAVRPASCYYGGGRSVDRAAVVETGTQALEQRIRMIAGARERIILSTFDMREGESSKDMAAALMAAADRGVSVRVLVDGVSGAIRMEGRPLFYALGAYPNIEVRVYNTPNPLKPWTIHGRMHDKYIIADDTCYLLGGRNTFDYFLGDYTEKNKSYDREVLVYNTACEYPKSGERENGDVETGFSSLHQVASYFESVWDSPYVKVFHNEEKLLGRKKVKLYEFDAGASSHGKSLLIDGDICVVGSYNLDLRSTYMDTELMLVVHSEALNRQLEDCMDVFHAKTRRVLSESEYHIPEGLKIATVPPAKKFLLRLLGFVLAPFRYVI